MFGKLKDFFGFFVLCGGLATASSFSMVKGAKTKDHSTPTALLSIEKDLKNLPSKLAEKAVKRPTLVQSINTVLVRKAKALSHYPESEEIEVQRPSRRKSIKVSGTTSPPNP